MGWGEEFQDNINTHFGEVIKQDGLEWLRNVCCGDRITVQ